MSKQASKDRARLSRADRIRLIVGGILALVFLAGAATSFLWRDRFATESLRRPAQGENTGSYTYEASDRQRFACLGGGLLCAGTAGFCLQDSEGSVLAQTVTAMSEPAVSVCESYAAVYDPGGSTLWLVEADGRQQRLDFDGGILLAEVSDGGYMTVIGRETGYRGLVRVYGPDHRELYRWYAGSAWPISARMSPNGRTLAVLCVSSDGSEIKFFDLDSEVQQAAFSVSDTVLLDLHWFSDTELCSFSSEGVLFFSAEGSWSGTYDFGGNYLVGCAQGGSGFIAFALSPFRSGTAATVVTLDAGGRVLGQRDTDTQILSMHAKDGELLVLCAGSAALYSPSLSEKGRAGELTGFKQAIIRSKGEAVFLASGFAEVYKF